MQTRRIEVKPNDPLIQKAEATYFPIILNPTCKLQTRKGKGKKKPSLEWDNQISTALEFEGGLWIMKGGMWDGAIDVEEIYLRKLVPLEEYGGETARRYCPDRNYVGMVISFQGKEYAVSAEELTIAYHGETAERSEFVAEARRRQREQI